MVHIYIRFSASCSCVFLFCLERTEVGCKMLKLLVVRSSIIPSVATEAIFISLSCVFGPWRCVFLMKTNLMKRRRNKFPLVCVTSFWFAALPTGGRAVFSLRA